MFYSDSTIWFSKERGIGESYYILCPACGNSGIRTVRWEDGTGEEGECSICRRMEETMILAAIPGTEG